MGMHCKNFSSASVNSDQRRSTGFPMCTAINLSLNQPLKTSIWASPIFLIAGLVWVSVYEQRVLENILQ